MSAPDVEGLPWPEGEPGALRDAAAGLRSVAGRLSDAGSGLGGAVSVDGWQGGAAGAYSVLVSAQVQSLQGAVEVFESVQAALIALGDLLQAAQDRIKAEAARVKEAREAAERAEQMATEAGDRMAAVPGSGGAEAAYLHLCASAGRARSEYEEVRQHAESIARRLVAEVKAADEATAGEVGEAKVAASAGPGGLPAAASQVDIDPAALAWTYAPHLRFHPDEQHMPSDFAEALRRGMLRQDEDGNWYLDLPDDMHRGSGWDAPVDYSIVERDGRQYIVYRVFYGYNDKSAGDHEGDIELFAVELGEDGKPAAALLYGHGAPHRIPWEQIGREGNHPISYVASGSHASYPEPGHYPISKKGPVHLATDQAADGGARAQVEQHLREGREHYPFPPGTRIGETTQSPIGANSPAAPNEGPNAEPFPVGSRPLEGAPEQGDGIDGVPRDIIDGADSVVDEIGDIADSVL
jgi:hypothetical protein